jgi:hypothetical protein
MTDWSHGFLPREVIEMQRIQRGIINATLDILLHTSAGWLRMGDLARSILKQAHRDFAGSVLDGPYYVIRERGEYFMHPFARAMDRDDWRYSFHCLIDWEHECWIFEVMS